MLYKSNRASPDGGVGQRTNSSAGWSHPPAQTFSKLHKPAAKPSSGQRLYSPKLFQELLPLLQLHLSSDGFVKSTGYQTKKSIGRTWSVGFQFVKRRRPIPKIYLAFCIGRTWSVGFRIVNRRRPSPTNTKCKVNLYLTFVYLVGFGRRLFTIRNPTDQVRPSPTNTKSKVNAEGQKILHFWQRVQDTF